MKYGLPSPILSPEKRIRTKNLLPWFLNLYRSFLKNNGTVYLKTDSEELFTYTRSLAEKNNLPVLKVTPIFIKIT